MAALAAQVAEAEASARGEVASGPQRLRRQASVGPCRQ